MRGEIKWVGGGVNKHGNVRAGIRVFFGMVGSSIGNHTHSHRFVHFHCKDLWQEGTTQGVGYDGHS